MARGARFQFGDFTLEVGTRQLLDAGRVTHLSPKAFDLLHILLDRRPRVVAKKELNDRLWPDTFVSDVNLATLVAELRRALRDDAARPRFIRTIHRHGYAFSGPATEQSLGSATAIEGGVSTHWVVWPSGQVRLSAGDNILGRGRRVTVWLDSPSISRRHARIVVTGTDAAIEDLGSRNGTYVQGEKVTTPMRLSDGDEIRLGSVVLTYRLNSGQETTISTPA
jgi:DNA-binding winged helix-turn-helix (wHTH) protein